jgi:hypothetical protein
LLRRPAIELVEGPTQKTLPSFDFPRLQLALIDGPHAYPCPDLEYYYLYPHLDPGALLLIDDIDIPTINNMFRVLKADPMYKCLAIVGRTAFLERTNHPTFDPLTGWWAKQGFNAKLKTVDHSISGYAARLSTRLAKRAPAPLRRSAKRLIQAVRYGIAKT